MTKIRLIPIAASAVLAACSATTDTSPNAHSLDIPTVLAQASAGDPASFAGLRSAWSLPTSSSTPALPTSCAFSSTDQRFECKPVTVHGLTFTTSYYILDGTGASLTTANAALASAVRVVNDVTGTLDVASAGSSKIIINKHSDLTLSGLLSGPRVLNGTSIEHDAVTTTANTVSTTVAIDLTSTTANVVLPSSTTTKWPQSGSITGDMHTTTTIGSFPAVDVPMHAVVTFNGTSIVTIQATIGGLGQTCRIDLTGTVGPSCL